MSIWPYLYQYVKTNQLTGYFILFILCVFFLSFVAKRIKFPAPDKFKKIILILILLLSLVLRIAWLGFSSHTPRVQWDSENMMEHDIINVHAIDLTKGVWFRYSDGSPSGRRPIGYPLLLGAVYKIFSPSPLTAWALQLLLFTITILLIFQIARITFSYKIGLLAAFFFGIYPVSVYSIKLITDEHLFLMLWYLGIYLLIREAPKSKSRWNWLWYGLIFGYATMTRTHAIFMPLIVGFAYFLKKFSLRKVLTTVILVVLVTQAINLPWVIRNYKAWGSPVLYTTSASYVYAQFNSTAKPEGGGHIPVRGEPGFSEEFEKTTNEAIAQKIATREIMRWIIKHPAKFLPFGISRLLVFMGWDRSGGVWPIWLQYYDGSYDTERPLSTKLRDIFEETAFAAYYILLFFFIFSIVLIMRRKKKFSQISKNSILILSGCLFFWFLEHMIIYPDRKYRFPLEPIMIIFASYFCYFLSVFEWRIAFKKINIFIKNQRKNQQKAT